MTDPVVMLHIFPSFAYGGQQARFAAIVKGLGDKFSHHVVSLNEDLSAHALLREDDPVTFQPLRAKKSPLASISNLVAFRKLLEEKKPDVLCTYNWGAIEAALANRVGPRLPHVHFEDGFGPQERPDAQPKRRMRARRFLLSQSVVVVPSRSLEDIAVKLWKLKPSRVRFIANGIDFDRFQAAPDVQRTKLTVGTVGALRPEKNQARLIEAFIAVDREKKATLKIIGEGPERASLIAMVKSLEEDDRIFVPGSTSTPEEYFRDFDIFALSSDTEQAPISLMEAMAAGLPVVSTNVGDVADMVAEENRIFITPPGDDEAFAYALAQLLQNPSLRASLGSANRKKAKAEFSQERMIEQHRTLYLEAAGR